MAVVLSAALAAAPAATAQDGLGRLFSTPDQRATLDRIRERGPVRIEPELPEPIAETPPEPEVVEAPPEDLPDITLNGVVMRSNGPSSAWVNGRLVDTGVASVEGVTVGRRGRARSIELVLPDSGRSVALRPGQRIEVNSGSVLESYEFEADDGTANVFAAEAPTSTGGSARVAAEEEVADLLVDTTSRTIEALRALRGLFAGPGDAAAPAQ